MFSKAVIIRVHENNKTRLYRFYSFNMKMQVSEKDLLLKELNRESKVYDPFIAIAKLGVTTKLFPETDTHCVYLIGHITDVTGCRLLPGF